MDKEIESSFIEITTNKKMIELLEFRIQLMYQDYAEKTRFERNEIEISEIKTIAEIDRIKFIVIEKEIQFREQFENHINELDVCQN